MAELEKIREMGMERYRGAYTKMAKDSRIKELEEVIDSAHDYIRAALSLTPNEPMRFDYYAHKIEEKVRSLEECCNGDDVM